MLAGNQVVESIFLEMPVKRKEFFAVASFVPKNDEGPVVQRGRVIRHDVNDAFERRPNRRPRLREEVDSKMNCTPLVCGISARAKARRCVEQSWLIVSSHAEVGPRVLDL